MVVLSYFERYLRWLLRIARFVGMLGLCCRDVVVSSSRCMFVVVFVYLLLFRITRSVGRCFVFVIPLSIVLWLLCLVVLFLNQLLLFVLCLSLLCGWSI